LFSIARCQPRLTANARAALRSGRVHCRLDELRTCIVNQNFGRDKPAIAPNCSLVAGVFAYCRR